MKTKSAFHPRCLIGVTLVIINSGVSAAPLAWFTGPPLIEPVSGAATTAGGGFGNILIGGDGTTYFPFPIGLVATNSSWTIFPALNATAPIAGGAAGNGDPILFFGGTDGSNSTSAAINYSPSGDTVSAVPSMNAARSYLGYATVGGSDAYAIGGLDQNGNPLASAETYSADANTWALIASLPTPLYNFPAAYDGHNYIYVFGGRTNTTLGAETATVFRYSISGNTWTTVASMPVAAAGSAAAFGPDGKIYVVGGVSAGVTLDVVQVYAPGANSWTLSTPLPQALSAAAMGVDSLGRLIVMGGMDASGNDVNNVWRSQQLLLPDSAPAFTQYPATKGAYQILYSSSIVATGAPPPYYTLVNGPTGLSVGFYSGAIAWTPQGDQIGSNSVTIRATNYSGSVDWTFNITVAPPPPLVPTNLMLLAVTDTSITLSCDPENPFVGPVTYSIYYVTSSGGRVPQPVYHLLGTSPTNVMTVSGLQVGHGYSLVLKASAHGITTGYSARLGVVTTSPQPPQNPQVTGVTSTSISFSWGASPGHEQNSAFSDVVSYTISQYIPSYGSYQLIPKATGITDTSGTVTGLTPGSAEFWVIQAFDAQGFASSLPFFDILAVTNPVPVPPLTSGGQALPGGHFQFSIQERGAAIQTVQILASTDLADPNGWVQIGSVFPSSSLFTFTDTNAALYPTRFYKVIAP
ncbi:MAG TPA: kelch repeat-containing protein [Candidatus Binatia bacterium]|jgi:hypothetical protein|nr:kelch repeat-containing protein [Candidatus Binatia bacterium]